MCTGNIFRSPVAEAALRRELAGLDVEAVLSSAGLVTDGAPSPAVVVEAAREHLGLDLSGHRSHLVTAADVEEADLVIGMAREHVREAALLVPDAWPRSFTLKELVRRSSVTGPRRAGEDLPLWLRRVSAGRSYRDLAGSSEVDDVPDPVGAPLDLLASVVREIGRLVADLAAAVWPSPAPASHARP